MGKQMTFDEKSQYAGKACLIPYIDHIAWRLLMDKWQVNALDTAKGYDPGKLPSGVNLVLGDVCDSPKGVDVHDGVIATPLSRALKGCSVVYVLGELDREWSLRVDADKLSKITVQASAEGISDIRIVTPCEVGEIIKLVEDESIHKQTLLDTLKEFTNYAQASRAFPA